jgi:hypothetical protein
MMVNDRPFNNTLRPRTAGSAANTRRHRSWEITATASRSGTASSSARNARPSTGCTPKNSKKFADTSSPKTRIG